MKPTREIIGLRIISVADGTQVGQIKDYVLNPQTGTVDFFITDQASDYFGAKVIAFSDVVGLGEFALTIPDPKVIQDVAHNLNVQELLRQDVRVIGTKVLTKKGQLIGETQEFLIHEESAKIEQCIFVDSDGSQHQVNSEQVITFGKELLIVDDLPPAAAALANATAPAAAFVQEEKDSSNTDDTDGGFNLFEQRQLQYFVGKSVDKDITLDNGEVLPVGQPMSEDTIRKITSRSTLMEITSYLSKN